MNEPVNVLIIGGKGNIGSGLRKYMSALNPSYRFVCVDLPGSPDRADSPDVPGEMLSLDINADPERLQVLLRDKHLVVYLARRGVLSEMNEMTDLVFESILELENPPMVLAASSVHAVDDAYHFYKFDEYALIAERKFDDIDKWPERLAANMPACPINDYGHEKAYVESWCRTLAKHGIDAIAARWGGINAANSAISGEAAYFSVWCHQEDAARFVNACFQTHLRGNLPSGSHYFVISDNTYSIFDIETADREIGYKPIHNAETYYD